VPNRVLAERIAHERELRAAEKAAFDHERELRAIFDAHERELRLQAEAAVEKARDIQFREYERRLESMNEFREQLQRQAGTFMTIERFEREHASLLDRVERGIATLGDKIDTQEKVTVRQDATVQLAEKIGSNQRWAIATFLGTGLTLIALLLHLAKLY
jgi:hypothetical protein